MLKNRIMGVSLLEMAIAIGLIGLLLGAILLRTKGVSDQTRTEKIKADLRVIQKALDRYYQSHIDANGFHYYPAGDDWMTNDLKNDANNVLRETLYDPFQNGNLPYVFYKYTDIQGKDLYYVVFSFGPDGTADIAGIGSDGKLKGQNDDDIFVTNGSGTF